ncbi:hypothetical protein EGR_10872 [Echinococcus granulosus]|uniref:Uncharacterized protein n=1 Tax=Echinococcus granulosus TaxID=6210 RepID=W6TZL4_ECHGR|nr:hypothetical protein EGR_10872 [Echinococcus granulosus]EUB54270.1 hypothetical protein EGR_10872 [Echinococcus granulosus]
MLPSYRFHSIFFAMLALFGVHLQHLAPWSCIIRNGSLDIPARFKHFGQCPTNSSTCHFYLTYKLTHTSIFFPPFSQFASPFIGQENLVELMPIFDLNHSGSPSFTSNVCKSVPNCSVILILQWLAEDFKRNMNNCNVKMNVKVFAIFADNEIACPMIMQVNDVMLSRILLVCQPPDRWVDANDTNALATVDFFAMFKEDFHKCKKGKLTKQYFGVLKRKCKYLHSSNSNSNPITKEKVGHKNTQEYAPNFVALYTFVRLHKKKCKTCLSIKTTLHICEIRSRKESSSNSNSNLITKDKVGHKNMQEYAPNFVAFYSFVRLQKKKCKTCLSTKTTLHICEMRSRKERKICLPLRFCGSEIQNMHPSLKNVVSRTDGKRIDRKYANAYVSKRVEEWGGRYPVFASQVDLGHTSVNSGLNLENTYNFKKENKLICINIYTLETVFKFKNIYMFKILF